MIRTFRYIVLAVLLLASCSEKGLRTDSENAIRLIIDVPQTRATLFEGAASLLNEEIGGGDFTVSAYVAGNGPNVGKQYIADARVNYFKAAGDWRFATMSGGLINYFDYYWPKDEKLNFFAHMPMDASQAAVTDKGYTGGQPWFSFSLPLYAYIESALDPASAKYDDKILSETIPNQETLKEFIYAYAPGQDKAEQDEKGGVQLQFRHPFAALYFDLGKSYRMKLKSLTVKNIGFAGKYSYDGSDWGLAPVAGADSLYISVMADVPSDELNFNSNIGGPYIVMPQDVTNDVKLRIIGSRLGGEVYDHKVSLAADGLPEKWEAGMKYTYTLNLGEADEEILFKVRVEEWDVVDYKNEIDVE